MDESSKLDTAVTPSKLLWNILRQNGFKRTLLSRHQDGTLFEYAKQINPRRKLNLQIWGGKRPLFRVSSAFMGCSDTPPTEFTTYRDMIQAIAFETIRTDSKYAAHGSTASEKANVDRHLFYIQNKGFCGDCLLFWKENRCGYTTDLRKALKVSRDEADRICSSRIGEDIPWPVNQLDSVAEMHVNSEHPDIRKYMNKEQLCRA
jgi:hypothetical protein